MSEKESEFGKGFAYCLGLFLAHAERAKETKELYAEMAEKNPGLFLDGPSMWFNAAADHLYELEIPKKFSVKKRKEIKEWRDQCIAFRLCFRGEKCEWEDVEKAIQYAKDLLLEWDRLCGIDCKKGTWE